MVVDDLTALEDIIVFIDGFFHRAARFYFVWHRAGAARSAQRGQLYATAASGVGQQQVEIQAVKSRRAGAAQSGRRRQYRRGRSEEHTSELQSLTNLVCR